MNKRNTTAAILVAVFFSSSVYAAAPISDATVSTASNAELLKRMDELTRVMTIRNKMQIRFQSQLDQLGQEINQIKGSIEVFNNQLEQIEDRQRNLYQMLDNRQQNSSTTPTSSDSNQVSGDGTDKSAYQSAVNLVLNDKQYQQAITAFEAFVIDHPKSSYVPNAQYWLGQLLYKEKKRDEAKTAFLVVTEKYPESNKRADALLKIGIIDEYSGAIDSAKSFYQKTIAEYPSSSAASLADKRLKAL
ncbi:tol-pal system protein YbgF [Psychromonas arctica]|uniref:Cell division coordinator CpoB n=1 Tax=Psychromonas arctica TaxID=168275 RepID=A0ABU9HEX6_9GAMM